MSMRKRVEVANRRTSLVDAYPSMPDIGPVRRPLGHVVHLERVDDTSEGHRLGRLKAQGSRRRNIGERAPKQGEGRRLERVQEAVDGGVGEGQLHRGGDGEVENRWKGALVNGRAGQMKAMGSEPDRPELERVRFEKRASSFHSERAQ